MTDREDFLAAIKAEPENYLHRYIFADWLDEHGEHEEADRQRAFEMAEKWLRDFAGRHMTGYESETEITLEDVVYAGHAFVETFDDRGWGNDYFTQYGDESMRNEMRIPESREAFWLSWSVVTGRPVPPQVRKHHPFSCSC